MARSYCALEDGTCGLTLETGEPALTWSKKKQRFEVMPAPFPVFLGYFGPNPERFREAFAGTGLFCSELCR